jgi:hypothetical protein
MKERISFSQYRTIDLTILTLVQVCSQALVYYAAGKWFPNELYVISPLAAIVALVMMRWGGYAAISAVVGGLFYTALLGGGWQQYIIYGVGNLAALAALGVLKAFGKERVRNEAVLAVVFAITVQLLMQLGRAAAALLLGYEAGTCVGFITTDLLSAVFTAFVIWTARRIDGLFEDQKHYLLRTQDEREFERSEQF